MSIETLVLGTLQIVVAIVLSLMIKSYFPSYFSEKGKNLATKEDIKEITAKVEEIRVEYAKRQHISDKAFDKEFEILVDLWKVLVELRFATIALRPIADVIDKEESEQERKNRRLSDFSKAYNLFWKKLIEYQPFYPQDIYDQMLKIRGIVYDEAIDYQFLEKMSFVDLKDYWQKARENSQSLLAEIDKASLLIRARIDP